MGAVYALASAALYLIALIGGTLLIGGLLMDALMFFVIGPLFPLPSVWKPKPTVGSRCWAVITGADHGIGRSFALALARRGFNICVVNREPLEHRSLDDEIRAEGVELKRIVYNFAEWAADTKQEKHLADQLAPLLPDVHILVNNVGTMGGASYDDVMRPLFEPRPSGMSAGDMASGIIRVNQDSVLLFTRLVVPSMLRRRSGVLINISSLCAYEGFWGSSVYCATKAFVLVLTEALRQELAPSGIVVQAVTPSFVSTNLLSPALRAILPEYISVTPDKVARGSLDVLGWQAVTHGCFIHALQNRSFLVARLLVPTCIRDRIVRFTTGHLGRLTRQQRGSATDSALLRNTSD